MHSSIFTPGCGAPPAAIRSASGRYQSSSVLANGSGMNGAATRTIGASSSSKPTSAMRAAISAPTPKASTASCTMTRRCVFASEASTAASSQGCSERRSITSASMPSAARLRRGRDARLAHAAIGDDRDVAAGAGQCSLADRDKRRRVRQITLRRVECLVLDHDHRIGIVDRRAQRAHRRRRRSPGRRPSGRAHARARLPGTANAAGRH